MKPIVDNWDRIGRDPFIGIGVTDNDLAVTVASYFSFEDKAFTCRLRRPGKQGNTCKQHYIKNSSHRINLYTFSMFSINQLTLGRWTLIEKWWPSIVSPTPPLSYHPAATRHTVPHFPI